jgi:hypothetical protein
MIKNLLTLATFVFISNTAIADTGYLCIADLVSGFNHNAERGSWEHATFLPGERFLISEVRRDVYKVETTGERNAWSTICTMRTAQSGDSFSCESGTNELHFNRAEQRFTAFRYFGYWNGSRDSVSITIGKCFPT